MVESRRFAGRAVGAVWYDCESPMRILHTADWHLGHSLHELDRTYEHKCFLDWLSNTLVERAVDVLLICGDVFDGANPPASAEAAWYSFLAEARRRMPRLDIIVIGGNHDSAARLEAATDLLFALKIHVVGRLHRNVDGTLDVDRLLVPVGGQDGHQAIVAAVPYLRPSDRVPAQKHLSADVDPFVEGVRSVYDTVLTEARRRTPSGQPVIAMGHCFMVGTDVSRLSERRILGGHQHALPANIFKPRSGFRSSRRAADETHREPERNVSPYLSIPPLRSIGRGKPPRSAGATSSPVMDRGSEATSSPAYVALGHMHKAQRVGRDTIRYSGSPVPLAMPEAAYRNQVVCVDIVDGETQSIEPVLVPRAIEFLRIPKRGAQPIEEVVRQLEELPIIDTSVPEFRRPYLEVCVSLPSPQPMLRQTIEKTLAEKHARLVRLSVEYTGDGASLAESVSHGHLKDLDPEDVFVHRYHRDHEQAPTKQVLDAFRELLDEAEQEMKR